MDSLYMEMLISDPHLNMKLADEGFKKKFLG